MSSMQRPIGQKLKKRRKPATPRHLKVQIGRVGWWLLGVIFVLLLIGGLGIGAYFQQSRIISLWPGFADLLIAWDLRTPAGQGLRIDELKFRSLRQNQEDFAEISGVVSNPTDEERLLTPMQLAFVGSGGARRIKKTETPPVPVLAPKAEAKFTFIVKVEDEDRAIEELSVEVEFVYPPPAPEAPSPSPEAPPSQETPPPAPTTAVPALAGSPLVIGSNGQPPRRLVQDGNEYLEISGIITNVSEMGMPLPPLTLQLMDQNKTVIQQQTSSPPTDRLASKEEVEFRIRLRTPSPNAVHMRVIFAEKGTPISPP